MSSTVSPNSRTPEFLILRNWEYRVFVSPRNFICSDCLLSEDAVHC